MGQFASMELEYMALILYKWGLPCLIEIYFIYLTADRGIRKRKFVNFFGPNRALALQGRVRA